MSVLGRISRVWAWWAAALLPVVAMAAATEFTPVALSGDYEDGGQMVSWSPGAFEGVSSLGALVRLVADPKEARALHDQTSHVTFRLEDERLVIETFDRDGRRSWQAAWRAGDEFRQQDAVTILRFQTAAEGEEVILMFEPIEGNRLLQVTVKHLRPTLLGPTVQETGVFIFSRTP